MRKASGYDLAACLSPLPSGRDGEGVYMMEKLDLDIDKKTTPSKKKKSVTTTRMRDRRTGKGRRKEIEEKKSIAKIGMTASLGSLVVTGLMRGRGAKALHIWSGIALMGFSWWHHQLYQPKNRKKDA